MIEAGSALARRRLQRHVPDRPARASSTSTARSTRGSRTRSTRARTTCPATTSRSSRWPTPQIGPLGCAICYDWLFPEAHAPARRERRRGADPRLGVHGPVGRHRADGLVDDREPLPRAREHGLRGRRQPGREPAPLSAVLVAGRQHGRRLRRPASWPRPRPARASGSWSAPDRHHARCATSGDARRATTCWRTCAPGAYPVYGGAAVYPPATGPAGLGYEANARAHSAVADAPPCGPCASLVTTIDGGRRLRRGLPPPRLRRADGARRAGRS